MVTLLYEVGRSKMAKKLLTLVLVMSSSIFFCSLLPLLLLVPLLGQHVRQGAPALLAHAAVEIDVEPRYYGEGARAATPFVRRQGRGPRILTLLTTFSNRTAFAKANKEAMEERADGYESVVRAPKRSMQGYGFSFYVLFCETYTRSGV